MANPPVQRSARPRSITTSLRVPHWAKNVLLFLPLALAHRLGDGALWLRAGYGFVAFSLCASGVYVINDIFDRENDRQHPSKRHRPIASGALSAREGGVLAVLVAGAGLGLARMALPLSFFYVLLLYLVVTSAYTARLKGIPVVDVMVLAGLYTTRIFAGAIAVDVDVSPWFLAFSIFFFLNLAFLKRYAELLMRERYQHSHTLGRGYTVDDLSLFRVFGPVSGYLSVLVFALYVNADAVVALYAQASALWLVCPLLLYWISRMWFSTHRGEMHDDPVLFALKDPPSYAVVLAIAAVMAFASVG